MSDPAALLKAPRALWNALTARGGLDLNYHADMDEHVLGELARRLGVASADRIEVAIDDPSLTTETFLGALLTALGPFSRMLSDLLALFERVGARSTDASLRIDFDFGKMPPLSFDLSHFRDWLSRFESVRALVMVQEWSYSQLWDLSRALRSGDWPRDNLMGASETPAEAWAGEYMMGRRFGDHHLTAPVTGNSELDELLRQAFRLWSTVIGAMAKLTRSREELRRIGRESNERLDLENARWTPAFLAHLDSDHWGATVIGEIYRLAVNARRDHGVADEARNRLSTLFANVPRVTVEEDRVVETLFDFLNLPAWQRRHELYSAWVFALIAEALEVGGLRIHHESGRISFSFGGSHLATAVASDPKLHVWAELRSPLEQRSRVSRRKAIQPDYTLVADPISARASAVAVVECKQYREYSKRNFSAAMIDYATGRPRATVFLASYGPARADFLDELPHEMAERIRIFGDLRPNDENAREHFSSELRHAVNRWYAAEPTQSAPTERIPIAARPSRWVQSVSLSWGARPLDLDLHLSVAYEGRWTEINFQTHGSREDYPWAQLDHDVTRGYGPETITFTKMLDATYRCTVINYSNDASMAGSAATVIVRYDDGASLTITCPLLGDGLHWHVFDLDGRTGQLEVMNRLTTSAPATMLASASRLHRGMASTEIE